MICNKHFVGCWNSKFQKQIKQYYFLISAILIQPNSDLNDCITQVRLQIIMEQEWERVTGGREMRGGEDNRRVSERFIEETTFLVWPEIELRHDFWRLHHLPRYSPTETLYLSGFCLNSKTKSVCSLARVQLNSYHPKLTFLKLSGVKVEYLKAFSTTILNFD